jgi:uncharacterized protein (DUF952 family)/RimJ/RimL family protein N-acetyltransferase
MVFNNPVTDTLAWDGPESLEALREGFATRAESNARGETFAFTVVETESGQPVGSCSIRPNRERYRADIGLWIGAPFHGRGYGTQTVRELVHYGFSRLGLEKIEGFVFAGNYASRRIFEKNGFLLEGTIRKAVRKRGEMKDEWQFGITREDWLASLITHICPQAEWEAALVAGEYRSGSLAEAGFIHASRPDQVDNTGARYFKGLPDLLLLWIDPNAVRSEIRWEPADGDVFPHIYGPLNLEAVIQVEPFSA